MEKRYFCQHFAPFLMNKLTLFLVFFVGSFFLYAQEIEVGEATMEMITTKEWNILACLNTSGFGIGYQQGKTPKYSEKHLWELELSYCINHKTVLGKTDPNGRSFNYGKLYDLFFLRGGYGYQRTLTHKPYYGGVQIRYFFSAGISICFGLPTYIEIFRKDSAGFGYLETERYDPENPDHIIGNSNSDLYIYGAARFFDRFHRIAVRPGFYGKTGINFDFSKDPLKMQMLEVGVSMDMVFPFIQHVAFQRTKPAYFCAYIAYSFGKKKPRYDFEN